MNDYNYSIAFFGGEPLGVPALEALLQAGIIPKIILCNPDRPVGRKGVLTAPPVKVWAEEHGVEVYQPNSLREEEVFEKLSSTAWDLFVVVAYNFILPEKILSLPKHGTINAHPSLLPKYRGPSPIRSAILADETYTGSSIILLDTKMDHGPILAQERAPVELPVPGRLLDHTLAQQCGDMLTRVIPRILCGEVSPQEQDHEKATYTKKITKDMGELELDPTNLPYGKQAYEMYLKICAFDGNPGTFFFHNGKRIKITEAHMEHKESQLQILRVIPEGKKEMDLVQFLQSDKSHAG